VCMPERAAAIVTSCSLFCGCCYACKSLTVSQTKSSIPHYAARALGWFLHQRTIVCAACITQIMCMMFSTRPRYVKLHGALACACWSSADACCFAYYSRLVQEFRGLHLAAGQHGCLYAGSQSGMFGACSFGRGNSSGWTPTPGKQRNRQCLHC
jgi:hypothetical protein